MAVLTGRKTGLVIAVISLEQPRLSLDQTIAFGMIEGGAAVGDAKSGQHLDEAGRGELGAIVGGEESLASRNWRFTPSNARRSWLRITPGVPN